MDKSSKSPEKKPPQPVLVIATFLAGVAMGPVAWWQGDPLILALPALIPFVHHLVRENASDNRPENDQ